MSEDISLDHWKKCSVCKKPIGFKAPYYVCSVSTCGGNRTGYVFCRMQCFETHLPGARHRDAGAIEKTSPASATAEGASERAPARLIVRPGGSTAASAPASAAAIPREVLVIASRMKEYIQARADMNTSASVMEVLSDHLRMIADRAIDNARADGRKTVMDRDLEFLKRLKDSGV
ncbi:MAG: hypothetical protein KF767_16580 [Bdellovibrionaceae bacterium]|nr:hypothetical protein [Pseudobdellovibrionaceae bacterium]